MEWLARQKQRQDKYRRRQIEETECWNNDGIRYMTFFKKKFIFSFGRK